MNTSQNRKGNGKGKGNGNGNGNGIRNGNGNGNGNGNRNRNRAVGPKGLVFLTYGRMNPVHSGHKGIINLAAQYARNSTAAGHPAAYISFVTQTHEFNKNPLSPNLKVQMIQELYKGDNGPEVIPVQHWGSALNILGKRGYKRENIRLLLGYPNKFFKNNGTKLNPPPFNPTKLIPVARPPPGNASAISATNVREAARSINFHDWARQYYHNNFNQNLLLQAYNEIRNKTPRSGNLKKKKPMAAGGVKKIKSKKKS
jgi:hypothetical protein